MIDVNNISTPEVSTNGTMNGATPVDASATAHRG